MLFIICITLDGEYLGAAPTKKAHDPHQSLLLQNQTNIFRSVYYKRF